MWCLLKGWMVFKWSGRHIASIVLSFSRYITDAKFSIFPETFLTVLLVMILGPFVTLSLF